MSVFPYNDQNQPLTQQAILAGMAASTSDGYGALRISTIFAGTVNATTSPLSADSSKVSAVQSDAGLLHMSAYAADAGLFRVSAIGGTAGDHTIVDGTTQTISATLTPISAKPATTVQGLVTNTFQFDAGQFLTSAKQGDAGLFHASAFVDSGSVSARSADANQVHVSSVQGDAGLFRVSAILTAGVSSVGAASFGVSAAQIDAGVLHTSAFVDSGSVSAKSGDANQAHVSAVQGDAGLLHTSALQGDANNLHASAVQGDAGLLHTSAYLSVATTNTGGASFFSTSAGIAQVSTVKSTAGRLYGYHLGNPAGVDQYLQVFNVSGGATLGTDVPTLTLYIPTLGGAVMSLGDGVGFSVGMQIAVTSTAAGNTAGASAMRVNVFYA